MNMRQRIEAAAHLYATSHVSLSYDDAALEFYNELLAKEFAAGRRREFAVVERGRLHRIRQSGPIQELFS